MTTPNITIEQYEDAIKNALSYRQVEILQILYAFPESTATAKELASVLSPNSPAPIVASGQIGKIGKTISNHLGVTSSTYDDGKGEKLAFFELVGPYYATGLNGERAGWEMRENLMIALENLNLVSQNETDISITEKLPTEEQFDEERFHKEGKVIQVFVNRYERNQKARLECIKHHSDNCFVCGFNFGKFYGDTAKGFIHVHHKTQLADIGREYKVDPINDLVPLCANCHSIIHLAKPMLTIEELKKLTKKNGS